MPDSTRKPTYKPNYITHGNYTADILQASGEDEHFWYYVIHRKGSNAIIDLVRFATYEEAAAEARKVLTRMRRADWVRER